MIQTISDLIKLLHRYPSSTRLTVGHNPDDLANLTGEVINGADGEIMLQIDPVPTKLKPKRQAGLSAEVNDALDQCDRILTMCDEVPERGEDFASEIAEKTQSIRDWIEDNDHVTDKQLTALDNMERGVGRWVERD